MFGFDTIRLFGRVQGDFLPPAGAENLSRLSSRGPNGWVDSYTRGEFEGCRFSFHHGRQELTLSAELPRLVYPAGPNLMPPWPDTRLALGRLRRLWRDLAGEVEPGISRLDAALDLPWPAAAWPALRAALWSLAPSRRDQHVQAGVVSWSTKTGPHIKMYLKESNLLRLEVTLNAFHALRRHLPEDLLKGLSLADIEHFGDVISRAALLQAAEKIGLQSLVATNSPALVERVITSNTNSVAQGLGVLGFIFAQDVVGQAGLRRLLKPRTFFWWQARARVVQEAQAEESGGLADMIARTLAPFSDLTANRLAHTLDLAMQELRLALGPRAEDVAAPISPELLETGGEQVEFQPEGVRYDYNAGHGDVFTCVAPSLEQARLRRDEWLAALPRLRSRLRAAGLVGDGSSVQDFEPETSEGRRTVALADPSVRKGDEDEPQA